jgi:hypothetical protein
MKLLELTNTRHYLLSLCRVHSGVPRWVIILLHLLLLMVKHKYLRWRQMLIERRYLLLVWLRLWRHLVYSPLNIWAWLAHPLALNLVQSCIKAILIIIELLRIHLLLNYLAWTVVACPWILVNCINFRICPGLVLLSSYVCGQLWICNHILLGHSPEHLSPRWRLLNI